MAAKIDPWIFIAAHGGPEEAAEIDDPPKGLLRMLFDLYKDSEWPRTVLERLAANRYTPKTILRKLAGRAYRLQDHYMFGDQLAENSSTPPDVLRRFVEYCPYALAANPSTPPEILQKLSTEYADGTREEVALNPSTPPEVLDSMVKDRCVLVRQNLSRNPSTMIETVRQLTGDKDWQVVNAALWRLARSENWVDRERVARSANASEELLEQLAQGDEDEGVREAAARTLELLRRK